ncbi:MAG TPA: hypothetical protein ENI76_09340 [Ignavibacteria bacterium]|nr:hypothetical protein [Ignavibacteria bacterium]
MDLARIAKQIIFSNNASLARSIRNKLLPEILSLFPTDYFDSRLYDTGDTGKGFHPGYVSFGLKPAVWLDKNLIGGILVQARYDPTMIRSNSPEPGSIEWKDWEESGGNFALKDWEVGIIELQIGYYNKRIGGSISMLHHLGEVLFTIDEFENIQDIEIQDIELVKSEIEHLVDDILIDPPEEAMSVDMKSHDQYHSLKKFLYFLNNENRTYFSNDELSELVKNTNKNKFDILRWLRLRGLSFDNRN